MKRPPPYAGALSLAASDPALLSRAVRGEFHAAREDADPTPNIVAPSVPALVWAGYLRREEDAYEITERGMAVLERQRLGRPRLPAPVQTEIGTGWIWAAPSLQCEEAAPHVQPQPRKLPRNLPAIARLATEHGFRLEEVPGDPGALRVIPPRGEGYGVLDFDEAGQLVCCAWELSERREDRARIMDLAGGVPDAELERWLRWGRVRARGLSACSARRLDELLRGAGLRPGTLGTGYIHPADPNAPAVARIEWGPGIVLELRWLESWGAGHSRTYPDGATEADVVAWLAPWEERKQVVATHTSIAPSPELAAAMEANDSLQRFARAVADAGCELAYHADRSERCADSFDHYEVRRNGAVVTRACTDGVTWWLLEGQKRSPVTDREMEDRLAPKPPAPAPEQAPAQEASAWQAALDRVEVDAAALRAVVEAAVESEVSRHGPASRPRPCRDAVLDLLAERTLPQQEIHTGHAEGTVKGTLCKLEREGLVERYTAPVTKGGRDYASTWWRLAVGVEEAPSLPVICTPSHALEMVRAAGLEPRHINKWIHRLYDNHDNHVGSFSTDGTHIKSIYWIGRAALSGEALTVHQVEAWLAAGWGAPEEPPEAAILSNEPPPLILEVRALAASCGREIEAALDVTRQRKAGPGFQCWKICNAAYKGGRILARLEIHGEIVVMDGNITYPSPALERVRAILEEQPR